MSGSTFKSITAAAGIEEGSSSGYDHERSADQMTDGQSRSLLACRKTPRYGDLQEAVYNSCNPAFVKVSQSLGIDRFYS
jgi:stage V sporulation protein D (sporulation-specific penicillin-binding protein)